MGGHKDPNSGGGKLICVMCVKIVHADISYNVQLHARPDKIDVKQPIPILQFCSLVIGTSQFVFPLFENDQGSSRLRQFN